MLSTAYQANGPARVTLPVAPVRPFVRMQAQAQPVVEKTKCMATCTHLVDVQGWILFEDAL